MNSKFLKFPKFWILFDAPLKIEKNEVHRKEKREREWKETEVWREGLPVVYYMAFLLTVRYISDCMDSRLRGSGQFSVYLRDV